MRRPPRRTRAAAPTAAALCAFLSLSLLAMPAASAGSAAPHSAARTSTSSTTRTHTVPRRTRADTNSDPVWYPLSGSLARMDCVRDNPGCTHGHVDDSMTLLTGTGGPGSYRHAPVYAAGAGVAHIGQIAPACGSNAKPFGNWVWINHGGGVVTRYAHLDKIDVVNGQYVSAGQQIGTTGNSGERVGCFIYYLNFRLYTDAHISSKGVLIGTLTMPPTMRTCLHGDGATLPSSLGGHPSVWNSVAHLTTISGTERCFPDQHAVTPPRETASVVSTAHRSLTASWPADIPNARTAQVMVEEWHPANRSWSYLQPRMLSTTGSSPATSTRFTGLQSGRVYRVQFATHSSQGWSDWTLSRAITVR